MEMLGSIFLPSLILGAVIFMLGYSLGYAKSERRNKFYRRICGM